MDIRYSVSPRDVKRYTTEELRQEFLIENLYVADQVKAVYSHVDRMVVLGIHPVTKEVPIDQGIDVWANFGTKEALNKSTIFKKCSRQGRTRQTARVELMKIAGIYGKSSFPDI